jgi:hypothetical protein
VTLVILFVVNRGYTYSGRVGQLTFINSNEHVTNPPEEGLHAVMSFAEVDTKTLELLNSMTIKVIFNK